MSQEPGRTKAAKGLNTSAVAFQRPSSDTQIKTAGHMACTPFDTLDSAHEYLRLLAEQVVSVNAEITDDLRGAHDGAAGRSGDALRLVSYKLHQLEAHVTASRALLNDLKMLRRVLVREPDDEAPAGQAVRG